MKFSAIFLPSLLILVVVSPVSKPDKIFERAPPERCDNELILNRTFLSRLSDQLLLIATQYTNQQVQDAYGDSQVAFQTFPPTLITGSNGNMSPSL